MSERYGNSVGGALMVLAPSIWSCPAAELQRPRPANLSTEASSTCA